MPELIKAKVRRVGSSLGVLIPKEFAEHENIMEGEEIEIGILKSRRLEEVLKLFGNAKDTRPFNRKINYKRKKSVNKWGMMDSFILSASLFYNLKILTKDSYFKDLPNAQIL